MRQWKEKMIRGKRRGKASDRARARMEYQARWTAILTRFVDLVFHDFPRALVSFRADAKAE